LENLVTEVKKLDPGKLTSIGESFLAGFAGSEESLGAPRHILEYCITSFLSRL